MSGPCLNHLEEDCYQPLAVSAWPATPFSKAIGGCSRSATIDIIRHDGKPVTG
jgi:hypothetical protein